MKRFANIRFFTLLFFAATCFFSSNGFSEDKVVNIRFSTFFQPTHKMAIITEQWGKEVEKRTGGKVKVTQYPGGTLTPAPQTYDSVVQGVADAGNTVIGYTMGKFPLSEVLAFPLGYTSGITATRLANEYFKKFNPKEFNEVKVLYFHAHGAGILHTKVPVNKLEDLKGLKIRTLGSNAEFISSLGGVPVSTPMGDAYDAISKGVADGLTCPYESLEGWKLGEVIKYSIENFTSAYTAVFIVMMNKDKWASIPAAQQKIIEQINKEWIEKNGKLWDEMDATGKKFSLNRGNKVIKLSAKEQARWAAKAQPLNEKYISKMKAKNLPGEEVLKFCQDYLKKHTK
ncbi:MAG: TRAP transporter substrate-binding protein [Spirochaetota bacterium]